MSEKIFNSSMYQVKYHWIKDYKCYTEIRNFAFLCSAKKFMEKIRKEGKWGGELIINFSSIC